jgi:hypothetical protein
MAGAPKQRFDDDTVCLCATGGLSASATREQRNDLSPQARRKILGENGRWLYRL